MKNGSELKSNNQLLNQSRRQALKKAAAMAGLAVTGSLVGCTSPPSASNLYKGNGQKKEVKEEIDWNAQYDVVVVGSGFAGITAAIEARRRGASVLVIEKMALFGGNSAINGGAFAVAGSLLQKEKGITDSVDQMVADMLKAGRGLNHVELLRVIAEGTRWAYEFTLEFGVKYKDVVMPFGGHSVSRTVQTDNISGGGILVPLIDGARKLGVLLKNRCKLEEIILDDRGAVAGIRVRDSYHFPDEESGEIRCIKTNRGLVMATGGFAQDLRFRMLQDPSMDSTMDSTNHPGATAEGLQALLQAGATPVQLDQIQLGPWGSPDEKGFGMAPQFLQQAAFPNGIMVDIRTGKRFVNENADRKTRADAMLKLKDAMGNPVYPVAFCTEEGTAASPTLPNALKYGVAYKFDSLMTLAEHYGIPLEPLKDQVDRYNEFVKSGQDQEFGKKFMRQVYLDKPPFYAARAWVKVHHCMGGVQINTTAQVIHMRTGKPIEGLFAAGEVTGGVHGASRLGSCAIADCLVMGRIAGQNAADRNINT